MYQTVHIYLLSCIPEAMLTTYEQEEIFGICIYKLNICDDNCEWRQLNFNRLLGKNAPIIATL